jgi:purine-nucleoside phosphorylase
MEVKTYIGSIRKASAEVRSRAPKIKPEIGIILGSGLANAVPHINVVETIPYDQIPGYPKTTVAGHEGKLILGTLGKRSIAVMQGRFHYYEGHSMESIAMPVRVLEYLGLKTLLVTAAVGSMNRKIKPGHFTIVSDHINLMGRNPLRAFHEEEFGEMFPDMAQAYDPALRKLLLASCRKRKIPAREGVYVAVGGPSYETPAEIRAFSRLGGDVVGMSIVPEVIVARQMGIRSCALAWTSNMAAGMNAEHLKHADVLALGAKVAVNLRGVLDDFLAQA